MLEALIFDVDGTLADTERDGHRPAFNAAFAEAGLDWHWDEALYGELLEVTGGKERIRFFCERHAPEFLHQADSEGRIKALHAAKTRHYVALCAQGIRLRPGVERLLRDAHTAGLRLAIATTTTPENVSALLAPDLLSLFEKVGAGDTVPNKKPAPDIYEWVLAQLALPATACLAIEDSANGLKASRAAGLATVITRTAYTDDHDFSGAVALLPDLGQVTVSLLRHWHEVAYDSDKKT
ncbi:MAG: HAD-IA family hydrolase [Sulfuritalea sp.]|nr:HAD-IA family hydrolase [Sulfuritalea sp.]